MFEFDPNKSEGNKVKHGIDFVEAQALWQDRNAMVFPVSYPVEDRHLLLSMFRQKIWGPYSPAGAPTSASFPCAGHAKQRRPTIMKTDKKTATEAFERRFDDGEDISALVDWSKGKPLHGGKRPGSGRKPLGRKPYTIRLKPQTHAHILKKATQKGVSFSEYIESLASR